MLTSILTNTNKKENKKNVKERNTSIKEHTKSFKELKKSLKERTKSFKEQAIIRKENAINIINNKKKLHYGNKKNTIRGGSLGTVQSII